MDRILLVKKHPHRPSHQDTKIRCLLKISALLVKYLYFFIFLHLKYHDEISILSQRSTCARGVARDVFKLKPTNMRVK